MLRPPSGDTPFEAASQCPLKPSPVIAGTGMSLPDTRLSAKGMEIRLFKLGRIIEERLNERLAPSVALFDNSRRHAELVRGSLLGGFEWMFTASRANRS